MAGMAAPHGVTEALTFVQLTPIRAIALAGLGFVGGLLSGFFGTGGAFIMTPGMMGLGVPGIAAVGANITHKFGKALVGAAKHREMGNVDVKLVLFMFVALTAGVQMAVTINTRVYEMLGTAGSNLYISAIYVILLSIVAWGMYRDLKNGGKAQTAKGPSLMERIQKVNLPPMINFTVANTRVSLWLVLFVGLATGYLAGTIGVGGFVGVPAMIYLLGVRTVIAAGTELGMAIFSGAYGALMYAKGGFVDIRLTLLLYLGSLLGIQIGAIATKAVREGQIKLVIVTVVALVAASRAVAIPKYLAELGNVSFSPALANFLEVGANILLYGSAIAGAVLILVWILQALAKGKAPDAVPARSRL
ncbi:MAG: hypothetical protein XD69_0227 [Clostridia bacterium 62_21]|nr:MAG: hypothetical protein XD69_0227 [Clostridia bacterium 62_21]HAG07072.1 sulfite exporter TauE/SafE family protein [Peptococcaceae bacterium]